MSASDRPTGSLTRKPPLKGRAKRRDEICQRLLSVIEDRLAESSFTELTIERLIQDAGISRSRFYVYFEDKGALLRALTENVIAELFEATLKWWSLPASREELEETTKGIIGIYWSHRLLMAAVVQAASYDPTVREQYESQIDTSISRYAEHISAEQAAGHIDPKLDPRRVATALSWMTADGLYNLVGRSETNQTDRLSTALTMIVWNTLYAGQR